MIDTQDTVIKILYETAIFHLYVPAFFEQRPLADSKKLMTMMFKEGWRNEITIATLRKMSPVWVEAKKSAWGEASVKYQREWKDVEYEKRQHPYKRELHRQMKAHNKELLDAVKRTKSQYEKQVKFDSMLNELSEKYGFI